MEGLNGVSPEIAPDIKDLIKEKGMINRRGRPNQRASDIGKGMVDAFEEFDKRQEARSRAIERYKKEEAEKLNAAYPSEMAEGDFSKSVDSERNEAEREIWQHEENIRKLNQERATLQAQLNGLVAQQEDVRGQLYVALEGNTDTPYAEQVALRNEYMALREESSDLEKKLAKVAGEIAERTSLINTLQKSIDVAGFSKEEEAWLDNRESAREELEKRKRALQEQLVGSTQGIMDQMAERDSLMLERGEAKIRKDKERGTWSLWVDKVKNVLRGIGSEKNLDNEIARMNGEIEVSFRKAENLIEGIKALDALVKDGEKAKVGSFGAERLAEYREIKAKQEQTMEQLKEEMDAVLVGVEEVEEEPMKKAA